MIIIKGIKLPKITGIALWPFIVVKSKLPGKVIINHERIHLRQQIEFFVFPFYLWYFLEWGIRLLKYRNLDVAYRNISFEREAYEKEKDLDFLKTRPFWNFIKYL